MRDLMEHAPGDDSRRTPDCLRFVELEGYLASTLTLSAERTRHIEQCDWCQNTIRLAHESMQETDARAIETPAFAPSLAAQQVAAKGYAGSTAPSWAQELGTKLLAAVRAETACVSENELECPAEIDAEGTLRVRWDGLFEQGVVDLAFHDVDRDITFARGTIREGTLAFEQRIPELGLREVRIPRSVLRLKPVARPPEQ